MNCLIWIYAVFIVNQFHNLHFKGRFLKFRLYHNFANLFYKLSASTFYKQMSKLQSKSKELKVLDYLLCKGFPKSAVHTS